MRRRRQHSRSLPPLHKRIPTRLNLQPGSAHTVCAPPPLPRTPSRCHDAAGMAASTAVGCPQCGATYRPTARGWPTQTLLLALAAWRRLMQAGSGASRWHCAAGRVAAQGASRPRLPPAATNRESAAAMRTALTVQAPARWGHKSLSRTMAVTFTATLRPPTMGPPFSPMRARAAVLAKVCARLSREFGRCVREHDALIARAARNRGLLFHHPTQRRCGRRCGAVA